MRLLRDYVNGTKPPTPIVYSGIDVVTPQNVDAYMALWKRMEGK